MRADMLTPMKRVFCPGQCCFGPELGSELPAITSVWRAVPAGYLDFDTIVPVAWYVGMTRTSATCMCSGAEAAK